MEEKKEETKDASPVPESKIMKYVRIALVWIFLAFLGIVIYGMAAKKYGW